MSFICPICQSPEGLEIKASLELSADARSDEISLQLLVCSQCSLRCLGVYEESRRGALQGEQWTHEGYPVDWQAFSELEAAILACPQPRTPACECLGHRRYGRISETGYWQGLVDLRLSSPFPLLRAEETG